MTELVQKGTLPTLEQLDDAGKAVVVNQTGNNYTLGAQAGPGTSIAKLDAEANPALTVPGGTTALLQITNWSQDAVTGEGMAVNVDGVHLDLVAGVYLANLLVQFAGTGNHVGAQAGVMTGSDGDYADAGPTIGQQARVVQGVQWQVEGSFWFNKAADGQIDFYVVAFGGTVPDTVTFVGLDLLKLA